MAHAGAGTDHRGTGRCKWHGGGRGTGGQKGNKNALTTGRFETIMLDTMDAEERELYQLAERREKLETLNSEIAIATVRQRRMLKRIADLKNSGAMTVVERTDETIATGGSAPDLPDRILSQLAPDDVEEITSAIATGGEKAVTKSKAKQAGTLGQIQAIEADLTAVQKLIAQMVSEKLRVESQGATNPNDDQDFNGSLFDDDAPLPSALGDQ